MHCGIIKADHPQFVNHADGGVKWSVHTWQSGALASAAPFFFFSVRFRSAILVQTVQVCCIVSEEQIISCGLIRTH